MTEQPEFTDLDLRALNWLPLDGSWRARPTFGNMPQKALRGFHHYHPEMVELDCIDDEVWRARLTDAGVKAKKKLPELDKATAELRRRILLSA